MKRILRIGKDVKVGRARAKEICELPLNALNVEMKAKLIQDLIPIGLWHVKAMLEHLGFHMLTAADGEEADMVYREHADKITCAILDLTMPKGDGWLPSARKIDGSLLISPQ